MKKTLSLLTLMLLCATAWAGTVTFDFSTAEGLDELGIEKPNSADWTPITSINKGGVTITATSGTTPTRVWNSNGNYSLRIYDNNQNVGVDNGTLTFSAGEGNYVTSIKLMNGDKAVNMSGTTSGVWSGIEPSVTLEATTDITLTTIEVTVTPASEITVSRPLIAFDPASAYEGDVVTCTITCATTNAAIQYSTDGTNYSPYNGPFTLTETTTVYAKATLGSVESTTTQMTITFQPATFTTTVSNIAQVNQLAVGTKFRMTGSATIVYADASKYIYIKDATGYTLLYNSRSEAIEGYTINNIVGTVAKNNGLFQVENAEFAAEPDVIESTPVEMTIPAITEANMNQYVLLKGVSISTLSGKDFTITDANGNTLQGRDNFSLQDFPSNVTGKKFDIEGFVGMNDVYDNPLQFYPTKFEEALTLDGMIVFNDNASEDGTVLNSDGILAQTAKGNEYIESVSDIEKVYKGKEGLKLGASSTPGSMTLNLKDRWNATKISFIAKRYNSGKATTMTVNDGNAINLTEDFALYEIPLNPAQKIQSIKFASSKYAYLKVINIEGEKMAPVNYTITLDNEPGNYAVLVNVKATVSPELPEGATLKYSIDGGEPQVYTDKGVKINKNCTLTFTAYDTDGTTVLATAGGAYNYVVNMFGDLNGDGQLDSNDLNILINLLLGKY